VGTVLVLVDFPFATWRWRERVHDVGQGERGRVVDHDDGGKTCFWARADVELEVDKNS